MSRWSELIGELERADSAVYRASERKRRSRDRSARSRAVAALERAEARLYAAEEAYEAYDGPRPWILLCVETREEQYTGTATLEEARREAREYAAECGARERLGRITIRILDPITERAFDEISIAV